MLFIHMLEKGKSSIHKENDVLRTPILWRLHAQKLP